MIKYFKSLWSIFMYHRLLHKYKEFEGQDNVIIGKGELVWSENKQGWVAPSGIVIYDRQLAIEIATQLNQLYRRLDISRATKRNSYR